MTYLIEGETGQWEVVVGLEVHAQIVSEAKLFSGAATAVRSRAQHPGVPCRRGHARHAAGDQRPYCVEQAVKHGSGAASAQDQQAHSVFERKNYFYADLPQGYQISQYHAAPWSAPAR